MLSGPSCHAWPALGPAASGTPRRTPAYQLRGTLRARLRAGRRVGVPCQRCPARPDGRLWLLPTLPAMMSAPSAHFSIRRSNQSGASPVIYAASKSGRNMPIAAAPILSRAASRTLARANSRAFAMASRSSFVCLGMVRVLHDLAAPRRSALPEAQEKIGKWAFLLGLWNVSISSSL